MKRLFKKLYTQLIQQPAIAQVLRVFERTPYYAMHWYLVVLFGITTVVVSVGLAWFIFNSVQATASDNATQVVNVTTVDQARLQKALDTYDVRAVQFRQLQQNAPSIVDPGR